MNAPPPPGITDKLPGLWRRVCEAAIAAWTHVINVGHHEGLSLWEQKRVRLLNGLAGFSLLVFPIYMLSLINSPDYVTFWLCFIIFCLNGVVLVLTHYRRYTLAISYFLFINAAFYAFDSIAKKNDGTEYTLIVFSIMGMLFFRSYWVICLIFVVNIGAFVLVKWAMTIISPFLYIPEMTDVHNQNVGLVLLALFWVVYYFKSENLRQEIVLEKQNDKLQTSLLDLQAAQAQLIQQEKLASLGELTAGIAHEIQNPLNFVNNFAELSGELLTELAEEQAKGTHADTELTADLLMDLQQNICKISQHGQRASGIVRAMLEHSRVSTGKRELTDINALCEQYLQLSINSFRTKERTFPLCHRTDFDPAPLLINVVVPDVGRVLFNLFTNAFYAVWERGQRTPGFLPDVWVRTRQLPTGIEIRISDNGTGIGGAVLPKIFQPFFTTKPTGVGTGLGLSLSHDIITKGYGGTLTAESQEGHGAEFVMVLPG